MRVIAGAGCSGSSSPSTVGWIHSVEAPPSQVWITGKRIVSPGVSGTCTDSPNCQELVVGERAALPGHDGVALGVLPAVAVVHGLVEGLGASW